MCVCLSVCVISFVLCSVNFCGVLILCLCDMLYVVCVCIV